MAIRILPAAHRALIDIWQYSESQWGEDQADRYIHGLHQALDSAIKNPSIWRKVLHPELSGIYFIRYEHHYLFFRELPTGDIGVLSVLHEKMDLPNRLREDVEKE